MREQVSFTVCVLLYGDFPDLASRCLGSVVAILPSSRVVGIRLGLNNPSDRTLHAIAPLLHDLRDKQVDFLAYWNQSTALSYKYPTMRRMLLDSSPVPSEYIVWLDDDTYLDPNPSFWDAVADKLTVPRKVDLLGPVYRAGAPFHPHQRAAIKKQEWYTGKDIEPPHRASFVQGGFWVARNELLQRWSYPFYDLIHNGGDVILGELVRQQDGVMVKFRDNVHANADEMGRESKAKRRGKRLPALWTEGTPGLVEGRPVHEYHNFHCRLMRLGEGNGVPR